MSVTHLQHFKATKATKNKKRDCSSGKSRFKDHKQAIYVLHKMANQRTNNLRDFGSTTYNQIRVYGCTKCSGVHLSSKENWDVRREVA